MPKVKYSEPWGFAKIFSSNRSSEGDIFIVAGWGRSRCGGVGATVVVWSQTALRTLPNLVSS